MNPSAESAAWDLIKTHFGSTGLYAIELANDARDASMEAFVEAFPEAQHLVLELRGQISSSLATTIEQELPPELDDAEEAGHYLHVLELEAPLLYELWAEEEHSLRQQLGEEAARLGQAPFPAIVLWLQPGSLAYLQAESSAFFGAFTQQLSLGTIAAESAEKNPLTRFRAAQDQLGSAEQEGSRSEAQLEVSEWLSRMGYFEAASQAYSRTLEYTQVESNALVQGQAYLGIGDLQLAAEDLYQALDSYQLAQSAWQDLKELPPIWESRLQQRMGRIYLLGHNHGQAATAFGQAAQQAEKAEAWSEAGQHYRSLAMCQERKGKWEAAIQAFEQAVKVYKQTEAPKALATTYQQIGAIYQNQLDWPAALAAFQAGLPWAKQAKDDFLEIALEDSIAQMEEKNKPRKKGFFGKWLGG